MSADNGIYILHTKDSRKDCDEGKENLHKKVDAYRVAEAGAVDNFERYEQNELHSLWIWLLDIWWDSEVFYSYAEAQAKAEEIEKQYWRTEYGICDIDATKYNFPWY